jgi:hypothetical protein
MLLALAKKLRTAITSDFVGNQPVGTLTEIALYNQPRYGEVDGIGPVRIEGEGNMVGFSPVTKCLDEHGETAWIPTELVRNIRLEPFGFTARTKTTTSRK